MDSDARDAHTEALKGLRPRRARVGRWRGRWGLWAREGGAELVGTALLVMCSCLPHAAPAAHRALAAGAAVAMLVQCFDHVSGAMLNPAMTVAAALRGRLRWGRVPLYFAAQLLGALLGALGAGAAAGRGGVTLPGAGVSAWTALWLEAALTLALAVANCVHWGGRDQPDSWPLRIGTTVAALSLAGGEVSGASMNPVRSLAPAAVAARWDHHWVYWVGPMCGAVAGALLHAALCEPPPAADAAPPPPAAAAPAPAPADDSLA